MNWLGHVLRGEPTFEIRSRRRRSSFAVIHLITISLVSHKLMPRISITNSVPSPDDGSMHQAWFLYCSIGFSDGALGTNTYPSAYAFATGYNSVDNNNFPLWIQVAPEALVRYHYCAKIFRVPLGGNTPWPPLPTPLVTDTRTDR